MAHTIVTSVQLLTPAQRTTMSPTGDIVYIGMPGKAAAAYGITDIGPFGKPWACLKDPRGWQTAYREYLYARIKTDADFALAVRDLHGKTLVCWCKSKGANCHGDILSAAAEWLFHGIEAMASCPRCGHDRHRNRECVHSR